MRSATQHQKIDELMTLVTWIPEFLKSPHLSYGSRTNCTENTVGWACTVSLKGLLLPLLMLL